MRTLLLTLLLALPAAAQTAPPAPAAEDCGCRVPTNPRGPR